MNIHLKCLTGILSLLLLIACTQESEKEQNDRSHHSSSLVITNTWARPAAEGANSAAYMTIHNHTSRTDTLLGASSDGVAMAEFHESYEKEGISGMRPADTLVIKAGSRLELKPGGLHLMLMQVRQELITGDSLQLSLQFARAGTRKVMVAVQ